MYIQNKLGRLQSLAQVHVSSTNYGFISSALLIGFEPSSRAAQPSVFECEIVYVDINIQLHWIYWKIVEGIICHSGFRALAILTTDRGKWIIV